MEELFLIATDCQKENKVCFLKCSLENPYFVFITYFHVDDQKIREKTLCEAEKIIEIASERALKVGYKIYSERIIVEFPDFESIIEALQKTENQNFKNYIAQKHINQMAFHYCDEKNIDCAYHHAVIAFKFKEGIYSESLNNLGYLFIKLRKLDEAEQCLKEAINDKNNNVICLFMYNYTILLLLQKNYDMMQQIITEINEIIKGDIERNVDAECLLVPFKIEKDEIMLDEVWNRNIQYAMNITMSFIKREKMIICK